MCLREESGEADRDPEVNPPLNPPDDRSLSQVAQKYSRIEEGADVQREQE
jgi:hypothetical protein